MLYRLIRSEIAGRGDEVNILRKCTRVLLTRHNFYWIDRVNTGFPICVRTLRRTRLRGETAEEVKGTVGLKVHMKNWLLCVFALRSSASVRE